MTTIRELITDLLEYDMEHEVMIKVKLSDNEYEEIELSLDDSFNLKEVYLEADLEDYKLINKNRLEELENIESEYEEMK